MRNGGGTAGSRDDWEALPVKAIRIESLEFDDLKSPQKMTILPPQGREQPVMSLRVASNLSKLRLSMRVASSTTNSLDLLRSLLRSLWALMEKQPSSVGSKLTCSNCSPNWIKGGIVQPSSWSGRFVQEGGGWQPVRWFPSPRPQLLQAPSSSLQPRLPRG